MMDSSERGSTPSLDLVCAPGEWSLPSLQLLRYGPLTLWLLHVVGRVLHLPGAPRVAPLIAWLLWAVWQDRGKVAALVVGRERLRCSRWWMRPLVLRVAEVQSVSVRFPTVHLTTSQGDLALALGGEHWAVAAALGESAGRGSAAPEGALSDYLRPRFWANRRLARGLVTAVARLCVAAVVLAAGLVAALAGLGTAAAVGAACLVHTAALGLAIAGYRFNAAVYITADEISTGRMVYGLMQVPISAVRQVRRESEWCVVASTDLGDVRWGP